MFYFFTKQTENSQLNIKISGLERKSNGKRDSFLAQTKGRKENVKLSAKVCSEMYLIEFFKKYSNFGSGTINVWNGVNVWKRQVCEETRVLERILR